MLRLGFSADLSANGSVHTETFKRAVHYVKTVLAEQMDVPLAITCISDGAHPDKAKAAAKELLSAGVDGVIGHFASAAASAASPLYEKANIPLLLPAATADALTQGCQHVFRLCPPDRLQIAAVLQFLRMKKAKGFSVMDEGTPHTNVMATTLLNGFESATGDEGADYQMILGRFDHAVTCLKTQRFDQKTLIFSDDCFHSRLIEIVKDHQGESYVCGLDDFSDCSGAASVRHWYQETYGENPGCYFFETVAAAQCMISVYQTCPRDQCLVSWLGHHRLVDSAIGEQVFVEQENIRADYCIWAIKENAFKKITRKEGK